MRRPRHQISRKLQRSGLDHIDSGYDPITATAQLATITGFRPCVPVATPVLKSRRDLGIDADELTRRMAIDKVSYDNFCWARDEKLTEEKIDFSKLTWTEGLSAIDAKLVAAPPPPC